MLEVQADGMQGFDKRRTCPTLEVFLIDRRRQMLFVSLMALAKPWLWIAWIREGQTQSGLPLPRQLGTWKEFKEGIIEAHLNRFY